MTFNCPRGQSKMFRIAKGNKLLGGCGRKGRFVKVVEVKEFRRKGKMVKI